MQAKAHIYNLHTGNECKHIGHMDVLWKITFKMHTIANRSNGRNCQDTSHTHTHDPMGIEENSDEAKQKTKLK